MKNIKDKIEQTFEKILWQSKIMVILAVISAMFGALVLIIMGTYDIYLVISEIFGVFTKEIPYEKFNKEAIIYIVSAIDTFLIATVLMIFGIGLYEIFISKIEYAERNIDSKASTVLVIHSLDELKNKLIKVIIIVLIVTYFKYAISIKYTEISQLLYLSVGIALIAVAVFLLNKDKHD